MESCNIYMLETAFFYSAIFLTSTQVVACINYWFFFFFFFFAEWYSTAWFFHSLFNHSLIYPLEDI